MRVTIYSEPCGAGIGGSEYCACVLGSHLAPFHEVVIAHHHASLSIDQLRRYFGEPLTGVKLRAFPQNGGWLGGHCSLLQTRAGLRKWKQEIGEGSNFVINLCHSVPPFCSAAIGILYVHFPFFQRFTNWPWARLPQEVGGVRLFLRRRMHDWLWWERMQSYASVVSNSEFTRSWTKKFWGCESQVIYPPVDVDFPVAAKTDTIIAVGRYSPMKRQRDMAEAFRKLEERHGTRFTMEFCGNPCSQEYYRECVAAAGGSRTEFVVGAPRDEIKRRLSEAKIFWHATGLGVDELEQPQLLEHFGIVTAEAMAAGCVPVVYGQGGQPEIVEHGVSGFCWQSLDELQEYTVRLMEDEELRSEMSQAARARAQRFSKQSYLARFRALFTKHGIDVPEWSADHVAANPCLSLS